MRGRIKSIRPVEGYGFLTGEDGVDRFFHREQCVGMTLSLSLIDLYVDFDPGVRAKGPCALNVILLQSMPAAGLPNGRLVKAPE
jgi:cold shock CspA family protein